MSGDNSFGTEVPADENSDECEDCDGNGQVCGSCNMPVARCSCGADGTNIVECKTCEGTGLEPDDPLDDYAGYGSD